MQLKKISTCFLVSLFLIGGGVLQTSSIYASSMVTLTNVTSIPTVITRVAKNEWRYRTVDGKLQKRLWSLSEGKWLTEWEWV